MIYNGNHYDISEKQTRRMAWMLVWMAFFLFCFLCLSSTIGVYYFFFESTVSVETVLQVGRGTAVINTLDSGERGVRVRDNLTSRPAQISTDLQSQSTISFMVEGAEYPRMLVALTLKNNSVVSLRRANRPRFDWSNGRYDIELTGFEGDMDIVVAGDDSRDIILQITTTRNELILINQPGRYTISSTSSRLSVTNRDGEMLLSSSNRSSSLLVPGGQDAIMPTGRNPVLFPARINLIENGLFTLRTSSVQRVEMPDENTQARTPDPSLPLESSDRELLFLPARWGCSSIQKAFPGGVFEPGVFDGRSALRLLRADGADTNGETRCKQFIRKSGTDVTGYNYLELETTFLINYQSLSRCGVEGSECPLMLHMQYVDTSGVAREWFQGFYYAVNPAYDYYPPRCQTCPQENLPDHQQINERVWYTFESGNFFNILPREARPALITSIDFYASGHEYDLFISDISLLAGITETVPITVPAQGGTGD